MKTNLSIAIVALSLAACSSVKLNQDQKLSTSFVGERVKIETKCSFFSKDDCEIVAVEAVGTATTGIATEGARNAALKRAEMSAQANVSHFLNNTITTTRVQNTLAKTIERGSDNAKTGNDGKPVEVTDSDVDSNGITRSNSSNIAVQLTETVNSMSKSKLIAFHTIDQRVVGDREVSVTIRWDKETDTALRNSRLSKMSIQ